jgi:hypothetical protein
LLVTLDVIEGPVVQRSSMASAMAMSTAAAAKTKTPVSTNSAGFVVSSSTNSTGPTTTITTVKVGSGPISVTGNWPLWVSVLTSVAGAIGYLTNLAALSWFGGWMGVTSKKASLAILKTMTFVMLIPWFCISVGAGIISMLFFVPMFVRGAAATSMTSYMVWLPLVSVGVTTLLTIAKDVFFIRWARKKLYGSLRQATQTVDVPMAPPMIAAAPASVRS